MTEEKSTKKKLLQIGIIAVIVLGVLAIYIAKTAREKQPVPEPAVQETIKPSAEPDNSTNGSTVSDEVPLAISEVDMVKILSNKLPVIIDFGADSCIPCKEMAPVLKKLNAEMQGKAVIQFVDVWQYSDAAKDFPIRVIPTQVLINADGTPYVPNEDIASGFTMYSSKETGEHVFTVHEGGLDEDAMRAILADMGVSE